MLGCATPFLLHTIHTDCEFSTGQVDALILMMVPAEGSLGLRSVGSCEYRCVVAKWLVVDAFNHDRHSSLSVGERKATTQGSLLDVSINPGLIGAAEPIVDEYLAGRRTRHSVVSRCVAMVTASVAHAVCPITIVSLQKASMGITA